MTQVVVGGRSASGGFCRLPGSGVLTRAVYGFDAGEDEIDADDELLATAGVF